MRGQIRVLRIKLPTVAVWNGPALIRIQIAFNVDGCNAHYYGIVGLVWTCLEFHTCTTPTGMISVSVTFYYTEYHTCNILVSLMSMKFNSDDSCFDANLPSSKMLKSYLLCLCTINHNLFLRMNLKKQLIYHFTTIINSRHCIMILNLKDIHIIFTSGCGISRFSTLESWQLCGRHGIFCVHTQAG